MSEKIKYSSEPIEFESVPDLLQTPEELARIDRAWLLEVQRRSAEFDAGRMKSIPAEKVFRQIRARLKKRIW